MQLKHYISGSFLLVFVFLAASNDQRDLSTVSFEFPLAYGTTIFLLHIVLVRADPLRIDMIYNGLLDKKYDDIISLSSHVISYETNCKS